MTTFLLIKKKTKFIRRETNFSTAVPNSFCRIWSFSENFLLIFSTQYPFLELVVIIYLYTLLSVTVIVSLMRDKDRRRRHQPLSIPFLPPEPQKSTWFPSRMVFCFWILFSVLISSKQARLLYVQTVKLHFQHKVLFKKTNTKKQSIRTWVWTVITMATLKAAKHSGQPSFFSPLKCWGYLLISNSFCATIFQLQFSCFLHRFPTIAAHQSVLASTLLIRYNGGKKNPPHWDHHNN